MPVLQAVAKRITILLLLEDFQRLPRALHSKFWLSNQDSKDFEIAQRSFSLHTSTHIHMHTCAYVYTHTHGPCEPVLCLWRGDFYPTCVFSSLSKHSLSIFCTPGHCHMLGREWQVGQSGHCSVRNKSVCCPSSVMLAATEHLDQWFSPCGSWPP